MFVSTKAQHWFGNEETAAEKGQCARYQGRSNETESRDHIIQHVRQSHIN
jgi:hypothetical protein